MKKVIIIGCPESGKSTFAKALHEITGIPLFHLDMMYWNADRTTVEKAFFLERLCNAMQKDEWIIDGNYGSTMELRFEKCDTVFFLDLPTEICIDGIMRRSGKARSDIPWIEGSIDPKFVEFVKSYNVENRPKVFELMEKYHEKNIIVFKSREEADDFLEKLKLSKQPDL